MFIRKDNSLKWNWILIGALITLACVIAGLCGLDKILYTAIHRPDCNVWTISGSFLCSFFLLLGKIFGTKMWLIASGVGVLFFFIYKAIKNEYDFRYAFVKIKSSYIFYIFCSVLSAFLITGILKLFIGRSRPVLFDALGNTYFEPWVFDSVFNSMPSGHSATGFAGLVMIGMLFPRIKWATWTLAIIIGISRIYVGAHWPSDVILGAFIGMVCADITKSVLKKLNRK